MERYFLLSAFLLLNFHAIITNASIESIKTKTVPSIQAKTVQHLIRRTIPKRSDEFIVEVNPSFLIGRLEGFLVLSLQNGSIKITATTGVAAASAFHYYLKYYCHCHISWETTQLNLPEKLPEVDIEIAFQDRFRYYQNVCTTSYSFVWWNWKDWEKHIDWMALNSFNLVLAFNGQEEIWRRVYTEYRLSEQDIEEHFTGPAFLSWQRMGNMRGWGGPLSKAWHERSLILQKQILKRMRNFGIIPVLPAFAGQVPKAFKRLYPDVKMIKMEIWNRFNNTYCCPYLIDPTEVNFFQGIGIMFIKALIREFGTDHVYSADTFNEMSPPTANLSYLANIGRSVFESMNDVDAQSVWVMQNWLFVHDLFFWTDERAKALLTAVPKGRLIILDLQSEQLPQYERLHQYFGHYFIWCMLHNFGGTLGMFGSSDIINIEPLEARLARNSTMIGTGITPEGINQNYVIYDLMMETAWRENPIDLRNWFKDYTVRRYGQQDKDAIQAFEILQKSVYNFKGIERMRGQYAITKTPNLKINIWSWYDYGDLMEAWRLLLKASEKLKANSGYLHDLVDVTRQVLQVFGDVYYKKFILDFRKNDVHAFQADAELFLSIFPDLDKILLSNRAFLLGPWLESAKNAGSNDEEKQLFEYNARNQITLWGPNGEIKNYANKQWSGIVSHYFQPRWILYLQYMNDCLVNKTRFDQTVIEKIMFEAEKSFTFDRTQFPVEPTGDSVEIASEIFKKWWPKKHVLADKSIVFNKRDIVSLLYYLSNDMFEIPKVTLN